MLTTEKIIAYCLAGAAIMKMQAAFTELRSKVASGKRSS